MKRQTARKTLLAFCVSVGLVVAAQAAPSIWTDKADYAPGETVQISGSGFMPGARLTIKVTWPDGSVVYNGNAMVVGEQGCFQYEYPLGDGMAGQFQVEAIDEEGATIASCTFTDRIRTKLSLTLSPSTVCLGTNVQVVATLEKRLRRGWAEVRLAVVLFYLDGSYIGWDTTFFNGEATLSISTAGLVGNGHTVRAVYMGVPWVFRPSKAKESFTLTVAPSIVCPGDITQNTDPGLCSAVVNWSVTATGIPAPTISCDLPSGSTFLPGTTTVTCIATNSCGTDVCSFTVTVEDNETPTTVFVTTPPNPDNDPTPSFAWTGTDNNVCTAQANLEFSTNLDGVGWSGWASPTCR